MPFYVFENLGVMDPRSITTFGVSSKEGDSPIGFFGTGLKYAIAVLLRLGCQVRIVSGGVSYFFGTTLEKIRNDEFRIVTMSYNGEIHMLGFTTELGKTWEAWQAFRELACNCVDEQGVYYESNTAPATAPDKTYVIVTGAAFAKAWAERNSIILPEEYMNCIAHNANVSAYVGGNEYAYYRGVRVYKLRKPGVYTYNLTIKMELTEDRTLKQPYMLDYYAAGMVAEATDPEFLRIVLTAHPGSFWEGSSLAFNMSTPGPQFCAVTSALARQFHPTLNETARKLVAEHDISSFVKDEAVGLDDIDKERIRRANEFLLKFGYAVTDYPIVVTTHLGNEVLGRAHKGTIYVSRRALMMGTKMLAGTILEEYLHLRHGLVDETRGMQNFLIDALISAGERVTKTPL